MSSANKPTLRVDWCSHEAAKYAVENWHYSERMPGADSVKVGAWENGKFIGCVLFGRGAAMHIGKPFQLENTEVCELVRVALTAHATPVSKIIAIALRFLKRHAPKIRLVVSFADSSQGHHGGIYQAGNWIFLGSAEYHCYLIHGQEVHPKTLHSRYGKGGQSLPWLQRNIDPQARRIRNGVKHKYVMPLDEQMRIYLQPRARPYPKKYACAGVASASNPSTQDVRPDPHAPSTADED